MVVKKRHLKVKVPTGTLTKGKDYGKEWGITKKQAQDEYIKGFMQSARQKRKTKYKGISGFDFEFY